VAAAARFRQLDLAQDQLWAFFSPQGRVAGLLLQSKRIWFPLFYGRRNIPAPGFLERFLLRCPLHAVQGIREDAELMEAMLKRQGRGVQDQYDYDLMRLDQPPQRESLSRGPPELILRRPEMADAEGLYPLQAAYEREEVLPKGAAFVPAACRLSLEQAISRKSMLAALLDGRVVGKIHISAESFSRFQIGGVYVHPGYRGRGVATRMTAVFTQELLVRGKGVSLFVKKRNTSAQQVYRRIGFNPLADYRICYY
jgi:predicted GNAT family acetyltransferase